MRKFMESIFHYTDYRDILKAELARRCRQNIQYSQGAFSRDIKLRPSRLSEILNGKQGLSANIAHDISKSLNFSNLESNYFTDLVVSQHGRSKAAREIAAKRLLKYQEKGISKLVPSNALEDIEGQSWHFLAILELLEDKNFKPSIQWIAKKLDIDKTDAKQAINLLEKHELWIEDDSYLSRMPQKYHVTNMYDDTKDNKVHEQVMQKAIHELESTSPDNRVNYTLFASVDENKLDQYRDLMETFIKDLENLKSVDGDNNVFCFTTHLFPICKKEL